VSGTSKAEKTQSKRVAGLEKQLAGVRTSDWARLSLAAVERKHLIASAAARRAVAAAQP
jgi:hypothetical protein